MEMLLVVFRFAAFEAHRRDRSTAMLQGEKPNLGK